MEKKIRAVLFDFDDTLGDREKYAYACYDKALKEKAGGLSDLEHEAAVQQCMILDQQGDINKDYVRDGLLKSQGIDLGDHFNDWWKAHLADETVLFPDAIQTLVQLHKDGYLTGLITNGDSAEQHRKIEKTHLSDVMDCIVVSGDLDIRKPDVRIFQYAAEQLGVSCDDCVYVGDLYHRDILGAARASMVPVWIWVHGPRVCRYQKVRRIQYLSDLIPLLEMKFVPLNADDEKGVQEMSDMASAIVREHFDPIIGKAQNDYMLQLFQTPSAIARQLKSGYRYYFARMHGKNLGFLAFYPKDGFMYLSKFYLYKEERGHGYAREMLQFAIDEAEKEGLHAIELNVNRNNDACAAYERLGFVKVRTEKNDIGNGFYMDDFVYRMEF